MTNYNEMLIDLLNEKVNRLKSEKLQQQKEIDRLKRQIQKMRKEAKTDVEKSQN